MSSTAMGCSENSSLSLAMSSWGGWPRSSQKNSPRERSAAMASASIAVRTCTGGTVAATGDARRAVLPGCGLTPRRWRRGLGLQPLVLGAGALASHHHRGRRDRAAAGAQPVLPLADEQLDLAGVPGIDRPGGLGDAGPGASGLERHLLRGRAVVGHQDG